MAVYTHVDSAALTRFLANYPIGPALSFKGIAEGVENSNYLLVTPSGRFILTLYEKRVRAEDLPFFVGLMEHLAARGLPCPLPVKRNDGAAIANLAGRPAAIVTFLEGLAVMSPQEAHCFEAGAALARLHTLGADFKMRRVNTLGPAGWPPIAARIGGRAETVAQGLTQTIARQLEDLGRAWPKSLPSGVVHADLFPDNVFFLDGDVSGLIDFYFACTDLFAYDLAVMLNAWCFDTRHEFLRSHARALFDGYSSVRDLSPDECAALPTLARGAALRFLLTRTIDWIEQQKDALVRPKNPLEYLKKLEFHCTVEGPEGYGFGA